MKNPVRYLAAALRDDYADPGAGSETVPLSDRAVRLKRIQEVVDSRTPTQRDADRRLIMARLSNGAERQDFEKFGWMSALNARGIQTFWQEMIPGLFDDA